MSYNPGPPHHRTTVRSIVSWGRPLAICFIKRSEQYLNFMKRESGLPSPQTPPSAAAATTSITTIFFLFERSHCKVVYSHINFKRLAVLWDGTKRAQWRLRRSAGGGASCCPDQKSNNSVASFESAVRETRPGLSAETRASYRYTCPGQEDRTRSTVAG